MDYESEILKEQENIKALKQKLKNIGLPRRTIAWQFANARYGNRNAAQTRAINKMQKQKAKTNIVNSQNRIVSLRSLFLGQNETVI